MLNFVKMIKVVLVGQTVSLCLTLLKEYSFYFIYIRFGSLDLKGHRADRIVNVCVFVCEHNSDGDTIDPTTTTTPKGDEHICL